MSLTDLNGLAVSTDNRAALARHDRALQLMAAFRADPLAEIDAALAEAPDFVMAHCVRAGLLLIAVEAGLEPELRKSVAAAAALAPRANERERAHMAAAQAWLERDFHRAAERYAAIAQAWPRDLFALQVAHQLDFFLGQRQGLRERPERALAAWREGEAGFGFILGMHAFGLEEGGAYSRAEDAGRRALAREPGDAWAVHAVAHVMEMQGRAEEGAAWLRGRESDWAPGSMLACHNWWHLALFHLDRGEGDAALSVYDRGVRPKPGAPAIELVDASAMLWRMSLMGVDPGAARWAEVAEAWAPAAEDGYYAFNDVHAMMAFLGAGRCGAATRTLRAMQRAAERGDSNAAMTRDVGLPLARGLLAFAGQDWEAAARELAPLPPVAHRFGGSNAQRDVIDWTLLEALLRAGEGGAARELAEARLGAKPESVVAHGAAARARALPVAAQRAALGGDGGRGGAGPRSS